jgi:predicted anti-sigma-YlaC factor YlaD
MFCSYFRWKISAAMDAGGRLSRAVEKHIRHCADCREFYNGCVSLAYGLRSEAAVSDGRIPPRLNERILRAVPYRRAGTQKITVRLWPVAVAACVALIVLLAVLFVSKRQGGWTAVEGDLPTSIQVVGDLMKGDFTGPWSQLVEKPLGSELQNLENNTESAVRFLVACVAVNVTTTENVPEVDNGAIN